LEAKKVCEEIAQLRQEQRTKENYLYDGYVIEAERLINAGGSESMERAEKLLYLSIPSKERPEGWKEVSKLLSEKKRHNRGKYISMPKIGNLSSPKNIMIEANRLAQNNPEYVIQLLDHYKERFVELADKIRMNNLLGHSYVRIDKYNEAMECYNFVLSNVTQRQQKIGALFSLTLIHRRKGDYESAIDSLENIIEIDKSRKIQIDPMLAQIRSEKGQTEPNKVVKSDLDNELLNTSRLFSLGSPINEVSDFLKVEIEKAEVKGLSQKITETKSFTIKQVEYLQGRASQFVKENKPKLAAEHFLSAVKALYFLESEDNDRIAENLKRYCAAKGDDFVIENTNWDVARTYYSETFRFSTNFVFAEKEFFDPKESPSRQPEIKLSQYLSTFHRTKEAFLGKSDWPINNLMDILRDRHEKVIFGVLRGLVLLASYNTEVGRYILFMAKNKKEVLDKLCRHFSKIYNKSQDNNYEFLEEMIDVGISQIRDLTQRQMGQFQFFDTNLSSFAQLREKTPRFLDWNPSFEELGVDFLGTDSRYFEEMKTILRSIDAYDSASNFDDKQSKFLTALQFVDTLKDNINKSPTYWGRTYMLPLVQKWKYLLEEDFKKRDEQASPELLIEKVERVAPKEEVLNIHVLISNKKGTRSASGIKLHILPSLEGSYSPVENTYEIGSIQMGKSVTKVISIKPITDEGRLTLNYQISYDRKGEEVLEEERTISVSLAEESFEKFDNPYTAWAGGRAVTEEEMFKGRDAFVDEIFHTLKTVGNNKAIIIHGQKRSGKSSILYNVARKFENDPASNFLPVELNIKSLTKCDESKFFHAILSRFETIPILAEAPPIPSLQFLLDNPAVIFINYMIKLNQSPLMKNRTLLLIIDEFTELYSMIKKGHLGENFMGAWRSVIDENLFSVLLAGTDDMPDFIRENASAFTTTTSKYVGYLDKKGAKELIVAPIWNSKKNTSRLQESAVKKMFRLTASSPYYIQILMDKLVFYMNKERITRATVADVDQVAENYIKNLQLRDADIRFDNLTSFSIKENAQTKLEKRVLQVIAHLTINYDFANKLSILQEFGINEHEDVEKIIDHLRVRNVLEAQSGVQAYRIQVELFKLWLNEKMPYERRSSLVNPYIIGVPVTGNNFYGRQRQVDQVLQNISHKSYLLDAEWRTGKTSLLYKIQHELRTMISGEHYFVPVFVSIDGCSEDNIWYKIAEGFVDTINDHPDLQIDASEIFCLDNPSNYKLRQLKSNVLELSDKINKNIIDERKVKFIIEIDEAQQINGFKGQVKSDLRNFLSQDLDIKPHLNSIIAGYNIERLAGISSSPWTNFMAQIHLEGLSDSDFESLINGPIKKQYGDRYRFDPPAIEKISEYSQRIPYDIQVYCNLAFDEIISRGESVVTGEIIERIKSKACLQIADATGGIRGDDNA
jgi:hypothetical protein